MTETKWFAIKYQQFQTSSSEVRETICCLLHNFLSSEYQIDKFLELQTFKLNVLCHWLANCINNWHNVMYTKSWLKLQVGIDVSEFVVLQNLVFWLHYEVAECQHLYLYKKSSKTSFITFSNLIISQTYDTVYQKPFRSTCLYTIWRCRMKSLHRYVMPFDANFFTKPFSKHMIFSIL